MAEPAAQQATNLVGIDVVTSQPQITSSINLSLLKVQTIRQLAAGIFITVIIMAATSLLVVIYSVTVKPDVPQTIPDVQETFKVTPVLIDVLANDKDPREANLTVASVTQPLYGTAVITENNLVMYTPNKYYAGLDYFNYTARNDKFSSSSSVAVLVKNHPPQCIPFTISVFKNSKKAALKLLDPDPLTGNKVLDIDGDILKVVGSSKPVNGKAEIENGVLYYTPNPSFSGSESINYTMSDSNDTCSGTIRLNVVNRPPVASNVVYLQDNSLEGVGQWNMHVNILALNGNDPDGDAVSWAGFSCAPDSTGTYCQRTPTYLPGNQNLTLPVNKQSCDAVRFKYTVRDSENLVSAPGIITVRYINCVCYKPVEVMFVLDGSSSVSADNWQRTRNFVSDIIGKFVVSATQARIGVVQFSEIASFDWNTNKYGWPLSADTAATQQARASQLIQMSSWTATLAGMNLAADHLNANARAGVPKVLIVFTDGAANRPCSCSQCTEQFGNQDACTNTTYWPGQTCANCAWDPNNGKWCMPCADPRPRADVINSLPGWKIVSIGVGDEGSPLPTFAWTQVQGLAYKKDAAFLIDWNQTTKIFQTIVDTSCDSS